MGEGAAGAGRPRKAYRTRNWRGYDRGLVARGDLTVWISPDLTWHAGERGGKRGRCQRHRKWGARGGVNLGHGAG